MSTHPLPGGTADMASDVLLNAVVLNVLLAVFNMIPVPPLDGSNVAIGVLPPAVGRPFIAIAAVGLHHYLRADVLRHPLGHHAPGREPDSPHGSSDAQPRVVSGMRPTGRLHLGHLVGALQNWIALQRRVRVLLLRRRLACAHERLRRDRADSSSNALDNVADWLAVGIDPAASTIFVQSLVPEHAELYLLLQMVTPIPWLERVPTYKEQIEQLSDRDLSSIGFPGLPACCRPPTWRIYDATVVPVGEDQVPHLELSREVVRRFNNFYGDVLVEPRALLTPTPRLPASTTAR